MRGVTSLAVVSWARDQLILSPQTNNETPHSTGVPHCLAP